MMLSNNGLFTLVKEASLHESDNTIDKFMTDRLLHCTMDKKVYFEPITFSYYTVISD